MGGSAVLTSPSPDIFDEVTAPAKGGDIFDKVSTPAPTPAAAQPATDWRDAYTQLTPHGQASADTAKEFVANPSVGTFLKGAAQEAGTAASNIGAGGLGMVLHPVETAKGIGKLASGAFDAVTGNPLPLAQDVAIPLARQASQQPL